MAYPLPAAEVPPGPVVPVPPPDASSPSAQPATVDSGGLEAILGAGGYPLPLGTDVYVARLPPRGSGAGTSVSYEAGGGAHDTTLWPASSVKVLAALGALAYLKTLGFTGDAVVATEDWSAVVRDLYDEAIRHSSNDAYDNLVEIAGVDWLNEVFLTPANGFADTVIQRSYVRGDVISSPEMTVTEADRTVTLPARTPVVELGLDDAGNRSTLAEMVESIRLVALDAELPEAERLDLETADLEAMADALLGAEGFIDAGVVDALGSDALVYNKPGWVLDEACVDVGLVDDPVHAQRFLLGISTPDDGTECAALPAIAAVVLASLAHTG